MSDRALLSHLWSIHNHHIQFMKTTFTPHYNNDLAKIMTIFPIDGTSARILFPVTNFQISKFQVPCVKFNFHVSSSCFIWIRLGPNFWIRYKVNESEWLNRLYGPVGHWKIPQDVIASSTKSSKTADRIPSQLSPVKQNSSSAHYPPRGHCIEYRGQHSDNWHSDSRQWYCRHICRQE